MRYRAVLLFLLLSILVPHLCWVDVRRYSPPCSPTSSPGRQSVLFFLYHHSLYPTTFSNALFYPSSLELPFPSPSLIRSAHLFASHARRPTTSVSSHVRIDLHCNIFALSVSAALRNLLKRSIYIIQFEFDHPRDFQPVLITSFDAMLRLELDYNSLGVLRPSSTEDNVIHGGGQNCDFMASE